MPCPITDGGRLTLQRTSSVASPRSFGEFWDDEIVPLICPTCQVEFGLTENTNAGNHLATVHGVVFDVLGGSGGDRVRRHHSEGVWALQAVAQIVGFGLDKVENSCFFK
jgi:hypothetical protein